MCPEIATRNETARAPGTVVPGVRYAGIGDEAGPRLRDQVRAVTGLGWGSIELRTVDGVAIADLPDRAFARLGRVLDQAGLAVACVDSRIANWSRPITGCFENDLDELAVLARRCPVLGTPYVRVMSYPNDGLDEKEWGRRVLYRMGLLAERAERAGLVLLHENCSGWAGRDADRMLAMLERVGSPALRLVFDIGNGVPYGYDAYDLLREVVDHVAHVHVKDADGDASMPVYTLPGEGRARVADCLSLLLAHGYRGAWSIEPHVQVRPHERLTDPGAEGCEAFVAYGRRLERLVEETVLPAWAARASGPPVSGGRTR